MPLVSKRGATKFATPANKREKAGGLSYDSVGHRPT